MDFGWYVGGGYWYWVSVGSGVSRCVSVGVGLLVRTGGVYVRDDVSMRLPVCGGV